MRIRQIKPAWWRDKDLQMRCRADTREFYVGLWMLADDAGWFEWDVTSIGAEVYSFVGVARREREVARHAAILQALTPAEPHLVLHDCGHAEVPKMAQHQRFSTARRVTSDFDRHRLRCIPAAPRGAPRIPSEPRVGTVRERNGTVGNGSAQPRDVETTETTPFGEGMVAAGVKPEIAGIRS